MVHKILFALGMSAIATGCAQSLPPHELADARAAYDRAAAGPAAQLNPAQLHVAEQQLLAAQALFDKDGDTFRTRDAAYVAERIAELADVQARTIDSDRQLKTSEEQGRTVRAQQLATTSAQLTRTRERLAATTAAVAQLAALSSIKNVRQDQRGTVITLSGSVLFASNQHDLLTSARETLTNVANALATSDPSSTFIVQGYTDSQGSEDYNLTLSRGRAETVRAFLMAHGIPADRITAEGLGPASPVADNMTPEGRANNRRVEIVVRPPAEPAPGPASTTQTTSTTSIVR